MATITLGNCAVNISRELVVTWDQEERLIDTAIIRLY